MNDERTALLEKIQLLPEQVAELVSGLSDEQMTTPFIEGEWTVAQNVHHLCDSHMHSYIRCKLIFTEDNPTLKPYDQEVWAALPDAMEADVWGSLGLLAGLHSRWTTFWQNLAEEDWARAGYHPESGVVTLLDQLKLYAWHGEAHLRQIANTLAAQPWETLDHNLSKPRLLAMALSSRRYFGDLWADLAEAQCLEPGLEADWSLKDVIAHVVSWESWMCANLATAVAGDIPVTPQSDDDVNRMNAEFTAANSAKSLAQVLAEFAANEEKISKAITAVPAEALLQPDYFPWRNGLPLSWMVGGNTFGHYREHAEFIVAKFKK